MSLYNIDLPRIKTQKDLLKRQITELSELECKWAEHFRLTDVVGCEIMTLSEEELVPFVTESINQKFHYKVDIFLVDNKTGSLDLITGKGKSIPTLLGSSDINRKDIIHQVFRFGEPIIANDIGGQSLYNNFRHSNTKSEIALPIKSGNSIIGVFNSYSDRPDAFDQVDLYTMVTLSSQISVSLKCARLYKQAQELSAKEERQRLAHELHDAVTQTLFSAQNTKHCWPRRKSPDVRC